jgi:hypothetical protein
LIVSNWTSGTVNSGHTRTLDLSGVSALNNQATVYIRLVDNATTSIGGGTVATGGTGRVDNFKATASLATSSSSDIIATTGFTFPTNIPYASNTGSDVTASNPEVFEFDIRDGGGAADADAFPTTLNSITFSVTNSSQLEKVALYDGTTELSEVAAASSITFSGLTAAATDGNSKTLNLRATYKTSVTDNTQFSFTVSSANASGLGSTFAAGNAGGAASSTAGDNNRIEVTATKLDFTGAPSVTNIVNVALGAQPVVSARDANNNTDLDYAGMVTLTNSAALSMTGNAVAASSGVVSFSALTFTTGATGFTLSTTNGDGLTDGTSSSLSVYAAEPTTQATAILFSGISDVSMTLNWTNGNGTDRIIVAKAGTIGGSPTDGAPYSANSVFGSGATIAPNEYVVYAGSGSTVTVTGLTPATVYQFRAYEYNTGAPENYLTSAAAGNPASHTTYATEPASASTSLTFSPVTGSAITANWTAGSGPNRIVVVKDGSAVTGTPSDASTYAANAAFGSGDPIAPGEFVVYSGTGSSVAVTGLTPGNTYHFAVFEFDGSGGTENYLTSSSLTGSQVTLSVSAPVIASPTATAITSSTATLGADVTSDGNDAITDRGIVWSTSANPDTLANRVSAGGTTGVFTTSATGLPAASLIHYRGYAINAVGVSYTTDATFYTLSTEPSTHVGSFAATTASSASIDLSWTVATGADGYLVLQRTGSDPTGTPTNADAYVVTDVIGDATVAAVLNSGAATSTTISGLTAGTNYHYSIIPYAWDGVNSATYDYRTAATIPTASAITFSNSSDVVAFPGFTYPSNVAYASYQENADLTTGNSVEAFKVQVRDGGGAADADGATTTLTAISFNVTNPGYLRRAALYNGATELGEVAVSGSPITFTGLSESVADDGSADLSLRVSYTTSVTDNGQNQYTVASVTAATSGSGFASANGGGATSSIAGDDNRIEVTATAFTFTTQPPVSVNYATNFSAAVTAHDANSLTDLDYAGNVTMSRETGTGVLSASSTLTHTAVSGVATWSDLQYDIGEAGVSLRASDGSITDAVSNTFTVTVPTSTTSDIVAVASSEATTISSLVNTAGPLTSVQGVQVWTVTVRDGGGAADPDALPTILTSISLQAGGSNQVTSWSGAVLAADLFDGATHIASGTVGATSISFASLSVSVADGTSKDLSVRLSLKSPLPAASDGKSFQFSVANANATTASSATSSQFSAFSTITSNATKNKIDVTATALAFTTQPLNNQLMNANIAPVVLAARDANGNTDLDYVTSVTLSSSTFTLASTDVGGLTQTPVSGVATWANLSSSVAGSGTVLANSGVLPQATSNAITVLGGVATSIASGNWSAGSTWDQGVKPSPTQLAVIATGHTVTLTANDTCASVTVNTGGILDIGAFKLGMPGTYTLAAGAEGRQSAFNPIPGGGATPWAFNAASTYTVGGAATGFSIGTATGITLGNLNWNSTANATPPIGTVVAGNLTLGGTGELRGGTGTNTRGITILGNVVINSGILVATNGSAPATGTLDIGGNLTINAAGTLRGVNFTGAGYVNIGGSLINNGGKIKVGDGAGDTGDFIVYFKGSGPGTITPGDSSAFRTVAIAPGRSMTLTDTLTVNSTYTMTDSGSLNFGTMMVAGAGSFTAVDGATLVIGSPNGITASSASGNVQVAGTRTYSAAANYTYDGGAAQVTGDGLPAAVNNLTINNASGVTIGANHTVNGVLGLQSGLLNTSTFAVEVAQTGSVSRTSGYVNGNLKKHVTVLGGAGSQTWEIGDATNYTPVAISGTSFTLNFDVTASTAAGDHASLGTSNFVTAKTVNRTYTLNGTYAGPYNATFNYAAGDVDGGANTANFAVGKYIAPNWTYPAVGTRTATSTQATGVTSFSDFAIGELITHTITVTQSANGTITPGTTVVTHGDSLALAITPAPGYFVDSVYIDGVYAPGVTTAYTFTNVTTDHTITAKYTLSTYVVTVTQGANGVIAPGTTVVPINGTQAFTITPNTGYHIDSVKVDGVKVDSTTSYTFTGVVASHTLTAFFSINTYTLTVNTVGSGSVAKAPDQANYDHGTPVNLTATPALGWVFSGWSGDATGNTNPLGITMTANTTITATFTLDGAYLTEYRSFAPESIAVDKDNKGKIGKYVKRKADKVDFKFVMLTPAANTGLKLKFSMLTSGAIVLDSAQTDTLVSWTAVKEVITTINRPAGDSIMIVGRGVSGKAVKTSFYWSTTPTVTKGTILSYIQNQPRLPMPNRVNALFETFEQGGFGLVGLLVGKDRTTDSAKQYGWFQAAKYTDVIKTLYVTKTAMQHTGQPRGFDKFVTLKPLVKRQKSLPPTKHNNALLAEMVAVKFSIAASSLEKIPLGFGELVYNDGGANPLNGMSVKDIAAFGDSIMMGTYVLGLHTFDTSATFDNLYATLHAINNAFEGAVDTTDFATKLHMSGVKALIDVPFLRAGTEAPAKIVPLDVAMYEAPVAYSLDQNYPNPFNPTTTISFDLPEASMVTLKVYNMLGQEVATILNNQEMEDGTQEFTFDASSLSSGVYFYRLSAESITDPESGAASQLYTSVKKMMLIK